MKKYLPLLAVSFLLVVIFSMIVFLLYSRSFSVGINNASEQNVSNASTTAGISKSEISFEESLIYICDSGAKVATAIASETKDVVELSVPGFNPVIARQNPGQTTVYLETENGLKFIEKGDYSVVEQNGATLFSGCKFSSVASDNTNVIAFPIDENEVRKAEVATGTLPIGKKIFWVEAMTANGELILPTKQGVFALTLLADGTFSASTDCNGVSGNYTSAANNALSFSGMRSTLMACEGDVKEGVFTALLGKVTGYSVSDTKIEFTIDNDSAMYFEKSVSEEQ